MEPSAITAESLMLKIDAFVPEDMSIHDLTMTLREKRIGGLPVKNKKGDFCGIVTVYELFGAMEIARKMFFGKKEWYSQFRIGQRQISVKDIYKRDAISVLPQTPLEDLVEVMLRKNLHSLPVMDVTQKNLYGMIGRHDLTWIVFGDGTTTRS